MQSDFAYFCDNLAGFVSISEKKTQQKQIVPPNQYAYVINTSFDLLITTYYWLTVGL